MNSVSVTKVVSTSSNDVPVTAKVKIGFGQKADTIIYVEGKKISEFEDSKPDNPIGTNNTLRQKQVVFQTLAYDIQKTTNNTSVDIIISGIQPELTIPMSFTVPEDGAVVSYTANIIFI